MVLYDGADCRPGMGVAQGAADVVPDVIFVLLSLVVGLVESLDNFVGDVECRIE